MRKIIHILFNFFLPKKCIGCGKENEFLCGDCLRKIEYPEPVYFHNILAAGSYQDKYLQKSVWLLKYRNVKELAEPLAELVYQRIFQEGKIKNWPEFLYIPIPLSKKRQKERGYNQAELISKYLVQKLRTEENLLIDVLIKIRETPTQVSIKEHKKRIKNLQNAFAVKNPEKIKGRKIVLIDDVSTTGTTIKECAKVLKEAGAKKVIGVVVAR